MTGVSKTALRARPVAEETPARDSSTYRHGIGVPQASARIDELLEDARRVLRQARRSAGGAAIAIGEAFVALRRAGGRR
jgi:hypothetical protein